MTKTPHSSSLGTALLAISNYVSAGRNDIDNEILMRCEVRISSDEYRKAIKLLSKIRQQSIGELMHSISCLCFWPIIVSIVAYLCWESWRLAVWGGLGLLIWNVIIRMTQPYQKLKKQMIDMQEVFENPSQLYITRSGIGVISTSKISITPWRFYKGIANQGNFLFIADKNGRKTVYSKSIFHSAEECARFEELVTALIAGKPIDHLIQPDESWPPKPSI